MTTTELNILGHRFPLQRHTISEVPTSKVHRVAYVQFVDAGPLKAAVWCKGAWHDHKRRPFAKAPVAWYSIEVPTNV